MGVKNFSVTNLAKVHLMDPKNVGYQDSIDIIRDELHRTRRSFVKIGWYLKHIKDEGMFKEDGYADIFELALDKFNISQPTATRFMNICKKFSKNHDSPELDEKFVDFSVSQLFEMLPMNEEQREQITPDMTVKQIRETKEDTGMKKEPDDGEIRDVCCDCLRNISDNDFAHLKEYMCEHFGKRYHFTGSSDLSYNCTPRGISINGSDEITWASFAKRAYKLNASMPFREDDNEIPGQTSIEKDFPEYMPAEQKENGPQREVKETPLAPKEIIEKEMVELEVTDSEIPEGDYRELPEISSEIEDPDEQAQPEFPDLKNSEQRKAWLADYKAWGLWYYDEHIDVNYYKYDFSDGSRLVVAEYPQRQEYWSSKLADEHFYHLLEKGKRIYGSRQTYDEKFRAGTDCETYLIEFLKDLKMGKRGGTK